MTIQLGMMRGRLGKDMGRRYAVAHIVAPGYLDSAPEFYALLPTWWGVKQHMLYNGLAWLKAMRARVSLAGNGTIGNATWVSDDELEAARVVYGYYVQEITVEGTLGHLWRPDEPLPWNH